MELRTHHSSSKTLVKEYGHLDMCYRLGGVGLRLQRDGIFSAVCFLLSSFSLFRPV